MQQLPPGAFTPKTSAWQVACALALHEALSPNAALAQSARPNQIITDGRTATSLSSSGAVTNVRTGTISGANAYNSFSTFNVGQGQTVNLHVPAASSNLVNIVRDQRTTVDGVLNAIKDGKIGGNVHFVTPNGMLVSATGVVNVGSLTVTTPTREFTDKLFVAPGMPNDAAVAQLQSGNAPRNTAAQVVIDGKVNAAGNVTLHAGSINVGGTIYSGARFTSSAPDFTDVVNANGIAQGTRVIERNGRIEIVADNDVRIAGTLAAPGSEGVRGGDITVRAGNNITLDAGAKLIAAGDGARSPGGTVNVMAANNAVIHKGALIDASAGKSGDGGAIEFSARKNIELAGGEFRADARNGKAGAILIDPSSITVSADILRGAGGYGVLPDGATASSADITLKADDSITVNNGITISSRMVEGMTAADHLSGISIGKSGDITLEAPSIQLKAGSRVLAHAINANGTTHAGGVITLNAVQNAIDILGFKSASADIQIGDMTGGATIRGRTVVLTATATADNQWTFSSGDPLDNYVNVASKSLTTVLSTAALAVGIDAVYSQASAIANVLIKGNSTIEADDTVSFTARTNTAAGSRPLNSLDSVVDFLTPVKVKTPLSVGGLYARVDAKATVEVDSGAAIKAANFSALAHNDARLNASVDATPANLDNSSTQVISIAVGITEADVKAKASIAGTLGVAGNVKVTAINEGSYENEVIGRTGGSGRAAAAVSYATRTTDAAAELKANVGDATKVQVVSINDIIKDFVTAEATAGLSKLTGPLAKLEMSLKGAGQSMVGGLFKLLKLDSLSLKSAARESDTATQVRFRVAGAIAYSDSVDEAHASIEGTSINVHATDNIVVAARVNAENTKISAASSAASTSSQTPSEFDTSREGYSAGVAIGNNEHNAVAKIGAGVTLTAPRIGVSAETIMPLRKSRLFGDTVEYDRWLSTSHLTATLDSITNIGDVFNGASSAKASGDESKGSIALSGSVSVLNFRNTSRALIDEGAKLNLSGAATGAWATEDLELAAAYTKTFNLTGIVYDSGVQRVANVGFGKAAELRAVHDATLLFQGGSFIPGLPGAEKGLGISVSDVDVSSRTEAIVREGAVIRGVTETAGAGAAGTRIWTTDAEVAAQEVNIVSSNQGRIISLATTSGIGATFGVTGSVSIVTANTVTLASLDDEASVRALTLGVNATASPVLFSLAGGVNYGNGASVGVGIAVNDVTGNTRAEIADNDTVSTNSSARASALTIAPYTAANPTGAKISAPMVEVLAHTGGRVEAIAVTGAVANQGEDNPKPGFFDKAKGKLESWSEDAKNFVNYKPKAPPANARVTNTQGTPEKPKFGLSGAGSASVNTTDMKTAAAVDGVYIDQAKPVGYAGAQALTVRGISDSDIVTATGAAAVTRANSTTQKDAVGIAGSIAVNQIGNGNEAVLRNSTVVNTDDVAVQALSAGEQLSVAIGMAVTASANASSSRTSAVGSLSLTLAQTDDATGKTKNYTRALIENATLTGDAAASGRDVDVTAYNRTFIGTGGGSLVVGGSGKAGGVGGAVTYSDIRNDVDSRIVNSTVSAADTVGVKAYNATEIGAGAAMATVSTVASSQNVAGAFVISEITNNTTAFIGDSKITASQSVAVLAKDQGADSRLENLIDPAGRRANVVKGLDYCGRDAGADLSPSGSCITSVAGLLALGLGSNKDVSASFNLIENNLTARVENSAASATSAGGTIDIKADSSAEMTAIALGIAGSQKLSAAGSVSIGAIHNTVLASASRSATLGATASLTADTVTIDARDRSTIHTLAGQIVVSAQQEAVGGAVTVNDIRNTASATAEGAAILAKTSATLNSENTSAIQSLAVGGAVSLKSDAGSVSISLNFIGNATTSKAFAAAGGISATFDDPDGGANTNKVAITATDKSTIESLAGSVAIGKTAGAGGAFAYNEIGIKATSSLDGALVHRAGALDIAATETPSITSLSVAAAGSSFAISGSISINQIGIPLADDGNVATAEIKNAMVDLAATQVTVNAKDGSTIKALAGNVAIGLGGPSFGGSIADNSVHNLAKASVSGTSLDGVATLAVGSGNTSVIESLSASGVAGAVSGTTSSNQIANRTIAEIADSEVTGAIASVLVTATDIASIKSLSGAAVFGASNLGAAVSINRIANTTDAHVTGLHASGKGLDIANLVVKSTSNESIDTIAAGAADSAGIGVAGSVAIDLLDNTVLAHISGNTKIESKQNVGVIAQSDDLISVGAGAIGISNSAVGAAASVIVNTISGNIKAYIANAEVAARSLAGTTALTVASGDLTAPPDLLSGVTQTTAIFKRPDIAALRATEMASGVVVNASATHHVLGFVANVGAGEVGLSGVANVNIIGGTTQAYIDSATINGRDNTLATTAQGIHVKASDHAYGSQFVGSVVAGNFAGVGLTADVSAFERDTKAYVTSSTLTTKGDLDIAAVSTQGLSTLVVSGAAAAGAGIVGAGSVVKFTSNTEAWMNSTSATVGSADVTASHATRMFVSGGAAGAGGILGIGATFGVAMDASVTQARIEGSTVNTDGQVNVDARSTTAVSEWTFAGAAAGEAAIAGTAAVVLIGSTTQAWVDNSKIGDATTRAKGLAVTASDTVTVSQVTGSGALAGDVGAGVGASVLLLQNTVSAYLNNAHAYTTEDIVIDAQAVRDIGSTVATAGGGKTVGLSGSVGVVLVGNALTNSLAGDTNPNRELDSGGAGTLTAVSNFTNGDRLVMGGNLQAPPGDAITGTGLSASEIADLNGRTRLNVTSTIRQAATLQDPVTESFNPATQLTHRTAAIAGGNSTLDALRDVRVRANEKDRIAIITGGGAIGGIAGVGGSVSVAEVTNNVDAAILGATQSTSNAGKIEIIAEATRLDGASEAALTAQATQVAGGAIGIGAAVAVGNLTNHVSAAIGRGTRTTVISGSDGINVRATDSTDINTLAVGATAGKGISAGAIVDRAEKAGTTRARLGNSSAASTTSDTFATVGGGGQLNIEARRSGSVSAEARGGAGGAISGVGADAGASETGAVDARIGNSADVSSSKGDVAVIASATPVVSASTFGVSAGAASVGASLATATSSPSVSAALGEGSSVSAQNLTISANRVAPAGSHSTQAAANGSTGGALLGVNATVATASSSGTVRSSVGDNTTLAFSGSGTISANHGSDQLADASGVNVGGLLAVGANIANATSNTATHVSSGALANVSGGVFALTATGNDKNTANTTAGSGGVLSGAGAAANTSNTSTVSAITASGDASHTINVSELRVTAAQTNSFSGEVNSINASVVGASGSVARHAVDSTVTASIGNDAVIRANDITLRADNTSRMDWLRAATADGAAWNIQSGSGGALDVAAASSTSTIRHDTTASIGDRADVHVLAPVAGEGKLNIDAYNAITGHAKALVDSGGVIPIPLAFVSFTVTAANATVNIGNDTRIVSDLGNINAGASGNIDIDVRANANAYGLAGQPAGQAYADYTGANTLALKPGALVRADDGAVFLSAGHNSAGVQTVIKAFADVHLWNKTAFPLVNPPDPRVTITSDATLNVPAGTTVEAAGDISLLSSRGAIDGKFTGVGKDIYREGAKEVAEFFGADSPNYDVTGGSLKTSGLALVRVDGAIRTGISRDQSLTLDYQLVDLTGKPSAVPVRDPVTGLVLWRLVPVASKGITFTLDPARSIEQGIRDRIAKLRSLTAQYAGDAASVAAYQSEINFLEAKLVQLGYANVDAKGNLVSGANNPSPRKAAEQQLRIYETQLAGATGTINNAATTAATTAANASTSEATILSNATAIDTQQSTINGNNSTIDNSLRTLAGFNAANPNYTQLNGLRATNTTLQGEINTRRTQNSTDRTTVTTKTTELNTLLTEISTRNSQIEQIVQTNPADAATQIATLRGEIETRQSTIVARVSEINTTLATISTRNAEIKTRADSAAANNTQIDALQGVVATTFGGAGTITPLRANNDAPRASVTSARDAIATEQNLFSTVSTGYVAVLAAQNSRITTAQNDKGALPTLIADITAQLPNLSTVAANGLLADYVRVNDISARLGNLYTSGDRLAGSGTLTVPGDARITITNNTPSFLVLGKMNIPADEGGALRFNGALVNSNGEIQSMNRGTFAPGVTPAANFSIVTRDTQGVAAPAITIRSNYDPNSPLFANLPAPAPDVILNSDISNLRGSVTVHSKAGSILSGGAINAATIDVKADNGDFVQSFVNGFSHVGGDPASIQDFGRPLGAGIVANGGVFISARFLNINSLVQSGIDNWNVNLPAEPTIAGPANLFGIAPATLATLASLQSSYDAKLIALPPTLPVNAAAGIVTYNFVTRRVEAPLSWANADRLQPDWAARTAATGGLYPLLESYGNVAAYYNPTAQRIELNGVQVRGGYIQLYGQIINTTDSAGAAKLRVLDGFGQIRVTNASSVPVVVNNLDTGADAAGNARGTAGKIDITDIQSARPDGSVDVIHSVYTRDHDPASGQARVMLLRETGAIDRRGVFTASSNSIGADNIAISDRITGYGPQSGLRYIWTTATDQSTVTYWTFKSDTVFGLIEVNQPTGEIVSQSGPFTLATRRLDDGTYLSKNLSTFNPLTPATPTVHAASERLFSESRTTTTANTYVKTDDRTECNWWTACIAQYHLQDYTQTQGTQTITTKSLKADYPIAIEFGGVNRGVLTVNSASDVLVNGSLANRAGTLTLSAGNSGTGVTNSGKSIAQINPNAVITAKDINLSATGSIGTDTASVLRFNLSGAFSASTNNGNVFVNQAAGGLQAGTITAAGDATQGLGRIGLSAEGDITAASTASLIQGNRVDLESTNGKIGSSVAPLIVNTGMPADPLQRGFYGLTAAAQGDIGISGGIWSGNAKGDLLVNTVVSRGGDVRLAAPGRIIDNNPIETIDQRTWNQLLAYWDSVALRANTAANAEKQAQTVRAFENGKTQDYRLYWQIRQRQTNPAAYDATFVYAASGTERDALTNAGLTSAQVTQLETSRTAQYHRLHSEVGSLNGGAFDAGFSYVADISLKKQLLSGSSWTERELGISITPALLKDITNTNPVIKAANAQGRRVSLEAGTAIGDTPSAITILASTLPENLTAEQKVALAAAERADIDLSVPGQISILQRRPFNFDASAAFNATVAPSASGHADAGRAFLASPGDARIDTFNVPGDARVKVRGSIVNDSPASPDLQAGNLVLEAANGGIGSATDPLRLRLATGAALTARAADSVSINATAGNLGVDTLFSRKDVSLAAQGSILDAHAPFVPPANTVRETDLNVLGENISLVSRTGGIGSATNALDVGVNLNGTISATAQTTGNGIYLNGPIGRPFNLANLLSGGAVDLRTAGDLTLGGAVSGTDVVRLVAGGALNMSANASLRATTQGVFIDAQSLTMADGASIKVDTGAIDIRTTGDAIITGIETGNPTASAVTIVSTDGRILDGGDKRLDIIADSTPGATITLKGARGVGDDPLDIRALNLAASSGGVADIAVQNAVNIVSITAADRVLLTAGGNITGGSVVSSGTGTNADKSVSITSAGGNVNLATVSGMANVGVTAQTGIILGAVTSSGGNIQAATTSGTINAGTVSAPAGSVVLTAPGDISAQNSSTGTNFTANASVGGVNLVATSAGSTLEISGASGITLGTTASASGNVNATSTSGGITAGATTALAGSINFNASGPVNATTTSAAQNITLASQTSTVSADTVSASQGAVNISASGDIAIQKGSAGTNFTANSSAGNVTAQNLSAETIVLSAKGMVTGGSMVVGSSYALTGDKVTANITAPAGATTTTQGAVTGLNGAPASDIQLTAANPAGFTFTEVLTQTGGITITLGDATFGNLLAVSRLSVTTPLTHLLIDQNSKSYQPFEVQLYSGGTPIRLAMSGRHVDTSAFALFRSPLHDVVTPYGSASSDEQAARVLADAARVAAPSDVPPAAPARTTEKLISFSGIPVALPASVCADNKTDCQ